MRPRILPSLMSTSTWSPSATTNTESSGPFWYDATRTPGASCTTCACGSSMTSGNPRLRTSSARVGTPNFGTSTCALAVDAAHRREVEVIEVVVREVHEVGLEHLGRGIGHRRVVPPRPPVARSEQPRVDQDRGPAGLDAQAAVPDDGELHRPPGRPRRAIAAAASTSSVPACGRLPGVARRVRAGGRRSCACAGRRRAGSGRARRAARRRHGTRMPVSPSTTASAWPATSLTTDGVPHAAASVMVIPHPSRADALGEHPRPPVEVDLRRPRRRGPGG